MHDLMQLVFQHSLKPQVVVKLFKYLLLVLEHTPYPQTAKRFLFAWLAVVVVAVLIQPLEVQMVLVEQLHLVRHF